jgi:alpha-tubulin suppressor-like RCC1 family protein
MLYVKKGDEFMKRLYFLRSLSLFLVLTMLLSFITIIPIASEVDETAVAPMIAVGNEHSVALMSDGTVWAWGWNAWGRLGNGLNNLESNNTPTQVLLPDIKSIAVGDSHTLALDESGAVWAWGYNCCGAIGNGKFSSGIPENDVLTPHKVEGLGVITAISAGVRHSLALRDDGTVWAWGRNAEGQIGDNTTVGRRLSPVRVHDLDNVVAISAGYDHSLALKSDGTVWAWGDDWYGQLGKGTTLDMSNVPVQVSGLTDVVKVAAGVYHSMALKSDGTVWAWGLNFAGQLGDGTSVDKSVPAKVVDLNNIVEITAGNEHSLAMRSDGALFSWGLNTSGQGGRGTFVNSNVPLIIPDFDDVVSLAGSGKHSMAVKSDGYVWAWGGNCGGKLGDGTPNSQPSPIQVLGTNGEGFLNLLAPPCSECNKVKCICKECDDCGECGCVECYEDGKCDDSSCPICRCGNCGECGCVECYEDGKCGKEECEDCNPDDPTPDRKPGFIVNGGTGQRVTINDALELLKFLAGISDNALKGGNTSQSWKNSLITQQSINNNRPGISDVLEILKHLASIKPNLIDNPM